MKIVTLFLVLALMGCDVDAGEDTESPDVSAVDLDCAPGECDSHVEQECERGHWLCIDNWTLQTCPNDYTFWETDCKEECGATGRCVYHSEAGHDTCSCFGP